MRAQDVLEKVAATSRRERMLSGAHGIVLGVSGGPDSLALLHLLHELREREYPRLRLYAGHLHHGMRGAAADEDAAFVQRQCRHLGVECALERADVPRLARARQVGEEVAGRDARYGFLRRLAQSVGAERIALGHHADDQAETVLMRVERGAGPRGMGGIPCARPVDASDDLLIVRPLLDCSRAEIEAFLRERGLQARLDVTNLSSGYLRNRIRLRTLPTLERQWGRGLRGQLCRLARAAQRLHAQALRIAGPLARGDTVSMLKGYVEADAAWLRSMPPSFRPELIQSWLRSAGLWQRTLGSAHYEAISGVLDARGGTVTLPGLVLAACSGNSLIMCRADDDSWRGFEIEVAVPGSPTRHSRLGDGAVTPVRPLAARLEAEALEGGRELLQSRHAGDPFAELMDMDCLALPLVARFRRPGDRMRPLGAPGCRKLQDILTDLHVPRLKRDRTLLVTMRDRPIWIVGLRLADNVKLTEKTRRVLRLRLLPASGSSDVIAGENRVIERP